MDDDAATAFELVVDADAPGWPVTSPAFALAWTPVLGPAATCLYRTAHALTDVVPAGGRIHADELGASLGLNAHRGRRSVDLALTRLAHVGLLRVEAGRLVVALRAPPPAARQWQRVPRSWRRVLGEAVGATSEPGR